MSLLLWRSLNIDSWVTGTALWPRYLLTALGLCNWTDMYGYNQWSRSKAAKNELMNAEQKFRAVSSLGGGGGVWINIRDRHCGVRGQGGRAFKFKWCWNTSRFVRSIFTRWSMTSLWRPYCSSLLYDAVQSGHVRTNVSHWGGTVPSRFAKR